MTGVRTRKAGISEAKGRTRAGGWEIKERKGLEKSIMPSSEHQACVVTHERLSVGVEVAEHGIAAPAADNANFVRLNTSEEEGHGSTRTKRAGGYLIRVNASMTRNGEGGSSEEARDHG